MEKQETNGSIIITTPIAILISGVLIAGAIFFTGDINKISGTKTKTDKKTEEIINIQPINKQDHIRGNFNAPIKIVEFSDTECPFCKIFHSTMNQVMADYMESGEIAWIYRHYPLENLHRNAKVEAIATECAGGLGGNNMFWAYLDKIFETTKSNDGLDLDLLPQIAEELGLDRNEFQNCLNEEKHNDKVEADANDAILAGANGTPYSVLITSDGKMIALPGAQSYVSIKSAINLALQNKK